MEGQQGKRKREEKKDKGDPLKKEEINLIEEDQPVKKKTKITKKKKQEEEESSDDQGEREDDDEEEHDQEQEQEEEEEEEEKDAERKAEVLREIHQDWQERMKRWKKNKEYKAPIDDQDNGWIQISKVLAGVQSTEKKQQLKTCKRGELLELWGIPSYLTVKNEVSCYVCFCSLTHTFWNRIGHPITGSVNR
jgi:hypothetical protein